MTVATFRDWIGHVQTSLAEFVNAKTDEQRLIGALRVAHNANLLEHADCPRAGEKVWTQAAFWIQRAKNRLRESGMQEVVNGRNAQDAVITSLAFAGEWK